MRNDITPYATTSPAATPILAFLSPGSVDGGPLCDTSQPHCLHSFASACIGSPQKLQYFFTLVPRARSQGVPPSIGCVVFYHKEDESGDRQANSAMSSIRRTSTSFRPPWQGLCGIFVVFPSDGPAICAHTFSTAMMRVAALPLR